eukprot:s565_g1.t1
MAGRSLSRRALAANVYISEGRDRATIAKIVAAGTQPGVILGNEFVDPVYNRSGLTLASAEASKAVSGRRSDLLWLSLQVRKNFGAGYRELECHSPSPSDTTPLPALISRWPRIHEELRSMAWPWACMKGQNELSRAELDKSLSRPKLDATLVLDSCKEEETPKRPHTLFALASLNSKTAASAEVPWSQLLALSLKPDVEPVLSVGRHKDCHVQVNDQ